MRAMHFIKKKSGCFMLELYNIPVKILQAFIILAPLSIDREILDPSPHSVMIFSVIFSAV